MSQEYITQAIKENMTKKQFPGSLKELSKFFDKKYLSKNEYEALQSVNLPEVNAFKEDTILRKSNSVCSINRG